MGFGKMNTFISLVEKQFTQDDEGFKTETDVTVAEVRAYRAGHAADVRSLVPKEVCQYIEQHGLYQEVNV